MIKFILASTVSISKLTDYQFGDNDRCLMSVWQVFLIDSENYLSKNKRKKT